MASGLSVAGGGRPVINPGERAWYRWFRAPCLPTAPSLGADLRTRRRIVGAGGDDRCMARRHGGSVAVVAPFVAGQWHPWLNRGWSPWDVSVSSTGLVWWLGPCGHAWQESPSRRLRTGVGCPVCMGERTRPGVNDLSTTDPALAARWDRRGRRFGFHGLSSRDVNVHCPWLSQMLADE